MMEGIIRAFKDRVAGVGWIDEQTVEAVKEKVRDYCKMQCWLLDITSKCKKKRALFSFNLSRNVVALQRCCPYYRRVAS